MHLKTKFGLLLFCGLPAALCHAGARLEPTPDQSKELTAELVEAARSLIGVPYEFGGRLRTADDGIDCQGVVFFAAEKTGDCGWKSFSTKPTVSVANEEIGKRVIGLDPVATDAFSIDDLRSGDILRLVGFDENPKEPSIGKLDGRPVWAWHSGLYSGSKNWVVGDHYAGEVVETGLLPYLREHREVYAGLFVSRLSGKSKPRRCRQHPPMKRWPERPKE